MKTLSNTLAAPFPWFGGKSGAVTEVWEAFGYIDNYVEPFCGSAAMLLGSPKIVHTETINDADGFVSNFWRAIAQDSEQVAAQADWPVNEVDLFARHWWLIQQGKELKQRLEADPDYYDFKIAGWWCWGACNWIGSGWCSGEGPWQLDQDGLFVKNRKLPHLGDAGQGINRKLPHLGDAGQGINRKLPHLGDAGRGAYIHQWFKHLQNRMRNVRVACGDWERVVTPAVTTRHGTTGLFLDPPYTLGEMDYAAGGVGGDLAADVRDWCKEESKNKELRIVLCGHKGEHDELLSYGWHTKKWTARKGYALTDEAIENSANETLYCSPSCITGGNKRRGFWG